MAIHLDDQTCHDCRFYISIDGRNRGRGECHRRPPEMSRVHLDNEDEALGRWPRITASDWCGEFQEKDHDDEA